MQRALGGTSGPLYAMFFVQAAASLRRGVPEEPRTWAEAFQSGCTATAELGGATRGNRTMLDVLLPAAEAFQESVQSGRLVSEALRVAATAAVAGTRANAAMMSRRGRSSYLGARVLRHADAGAEAVAIWLDAVSHVRVGRGSS